MTRKSNLTIVDKSGEEETTVDLSPLPFEVQPAYDWILVRVAHPNKTASGLHLPESYRDDTPRGEVMAVGPGRQLIDGGLAPSLLKVGDVVFLQGNGVVIDEKRRLYLVPEKQVLATLRGMVA